MPRITQTTDGPLSKEAERNIQLQGYNARARDGVRAPNPYHYASHEYSAWERGFWEAELDKTWFFTVATSCWVRWMLGAAIVLITLTAVWSLLP